MCVRCHCHLPVTKVMVLLWPRSRSLLLPRSRSLFKAKCQLQCHNPSFCWISFSQIFVVCANTYNWTHKNELNLYTLYVMYCECMFVHCECMFVHIKSRVVHYRPRPVKWWLYGRVGATTQYLSALSSPTAPRSPRRTVWLLDSQKPTLISCLSCAKTWQTFKLTMLNTPYLQLFVYSQVSVTSYILQINSQCCLQALFPHGLQGLDRSTTVKLVVFPRHKIASCWGCLTSNLHSG